MQATQQTLFTDTGHAPSIKMSDFISPFRYAGGKGWFVPYVLRWLTSKHPNLSEFVEPFAGGASIGLYVAARGLAEHVTLYEIDRRVAVVWQTIISDEGGADWLVRWLAEFPFSDEAASGYLARTNLDTRHLAAQTIMYNRLSFGGSIAGGLSKLGRQGYKGGGWASLWNIDGVCRRIRQVAELRPKLSFQQADALTILPQLRRDTVIFADPPYTAGKRRPGQRLYDHAELDHLQLFSELATMPNALLTYDSDEQVRALAAEHGMTIVEVAMRNNKHMRQTELVIGHDLSWLI